MGWSRLVGCFSVSGSQWTVERRRASPMDWTDRAVRAYVTTARTASRARATSGRGEAKSIGGPPYRAWWIRSSGGPRDLVPPASQGCEANQPMGSRRPAGSRFLYFSLHAFPIQFNSSNLGIRSCSFCIPSLASLKNSSSDVTATGS
jgi:hypothetical protein